MTRNVLQGVDGIKQLGNIGYSYTLTNLKENSHYLLHMTMYFIIGFL